MSFLKTPYPWFILTIVLFTKSLIREEVNIYLTTDEFHEILADLKTIGILHAEVGAAQAIHETNFLKSHIYKANHNMFGVKNHSRTQYCISVEDRPDSVLVDGVLQPTDKIHCYYEDDIASMLDYKEYQDRRIREYEECTEKVISTQADYLYLLENLKIKRWGCKKTFRYATDPKYIPKVLKYLKRYNALKPNE